MQPKKRVTHRDVAARAGVSTAVVSYVINNGPRPTSPEVRERVLQAISELGYHPNAVARGLRARRTNTIGFIVNDYSALDVFVSPYSAQILTGLTAQLKEYQQYVLVYPLGIGEDMSDVEQLLRSGRLDGVVVRLVQDPPETSALLELIASSHIPCVCIERPGAARYGLSAVIYDDQRGAYDAICYLIAQGHRRIGHIAGDQRYSTARARRNGYCQALQTHGLEIDESLIVGNDWDPSIGRNVVKQLLNLPDPPTAIFAASDTFAFIAVDELRRNGLRVPDDVAVIGFDDIDMNDGINSPLTTIRIPLMDLGRRAADLLLDIANQEPPITEPKTVLLPVELVHRGSA